MTRHDLLFCIWSSIAQHNGRTTFQRLLHHSLIYYCPPNQFCCISNLNLYLCLELYNPIHFYNYPIKTWPIHYLSGVLLHFSILLTWTSVEDLIDVLCNVLRQWYSSSLNLEKIWFNVRILCTQLDTKRTTTVITAYPKTREKLQTHKTKSYCNPTLVNNEIFIPRTFDFLFIFLAKPDNGQKRHHLAVYTNIVPTDEDWQESIAWCYKATLGNQGRLIDLMSGYSQKVYLNNCANTHISNCKGNVITYKDLIGSSGKGVGNVGGTTKPEGIGTVQLKWEDNVRHKHGYDLLNCRYFSTSPANILFMSSLGIQLGDNDDKIWIKLGPYTSTFTWGYGKFNRTIKHTTSQMPLLHINGSNSKIRIFFPALDSYLMNHKSSSF